MPVTADDTGDDGLLCKGILMQLLLLLLLLIVSQMTVHG